MSKPASGSTRASTKKKTKVESRARKQAAPASKKKKATSKKKASAESRARPSKKKAAAKKKATSKKKASAESRARKPTSKKKATSKKEAASKKKASKTTPKKKRATKKGSPAAKKSIAREKPSFAEEASSPAAAGLASPATIDGGASNGVEALDGNGTGNDGQGSAASRRMAAAGFRRIRSVEPRLAEEATEALPRGSHDSARRHGKYVYCIINTRQSPTFGAIGIGADDAVVHTVNFRDIAAVVSDTPIEVYDPTRENVLAHERVNETVMRDYTVIPMSFGTVFKTRDDIVELLRSAYDAFSDVLLKMQGKLEFGLKVLWDPDAVIAQLEKEDENISRLREQISLQRGSTYFARMQYGRLVDSLLQERSERYVSDIFTALRDVSVASRVNKPIGDRMILNAAFLVSRDQEPDFDARVKAIGANLDALTFKYTGPWPPYNFVNIRLKLERARDAE